MMNNKGLRASLKSKMPGGAQLYRVMRQWYGDRKPLEAIFSNIYHRNRWADGESVSGPGSTLAQTEVIRARLPVLLREIEVRSLLDAPCGDFNWMKETELAIDCYIGADIVSQLVEHNQKTYSSATRSFVKLDITQDALPEVDLILCRDCLFHLSYKTIFAALENFKASNSRYLLTTTFPGTSENINIVPGWWRPLNLQAPPFNLPPPLQLIDESVTAQNGEYNGKNMGLWRLDDIVVARTD